MSEFISEIRKGIGTKKTSNQSNSTETKQKETNVDAQDELVKTVEIDVQKPKTEEKPDKPDEFEQPDAWIEVVAGYCTGRIFPLKANGPVTVGRSAKKSQYVLEGHPEVSGLHFQLVYMPHKNGFYVIDESVNGLYYKGFRLEKGKKYKVLPGDQIGIGSMQCVITVGAR